MSLRCDWCDCAMDRDVGDSQIAHCHECGKDYCVACLARDLLEFGFFDSDGLLQVYRAARSSAWRLLPADEQDGRIRCVYCLLDHYLERLGAEGQDQVTIISLPLGEGLPLRFSVRCFEPGLPGCEFQDDWEVVASPLHDREITPVQLREKLQREARRKQT